MSTKTNFIILTLLLAIVSLIFIQSLDFIMPTVILTTLAIIGYRIYKKKSMIYFSSFLTGIIGFMFVMVSWTYQDVIFTFDPGDIQYLYAVGIYLVLLFIFGFSLYLNFRLNRKNNQQLDIKTTKDKKPLLITLAAVCLVFGIFVCDDMLKTAILNVWNKNGNTLSDTTTSTVYVTPKIDENEQIIQDTTNTTYYYSNEVTSHEASKKIFVMRDKGVSQCAIIASTTPTAEECVLSPYQNSKIGICGQDRYENDPSTCELMAKNSDGTFNFLANLLKPDYVTEAKEDYKDYYSGGIITGAELIKFSAPDKIIIFFGYDFPDSHRGTIALFDLKTKKLSNPVVDHYWEGDHSYFVIKKAGKLLLFLNDTSGGVWHDTAKERGIYLVVGDKIKKVEFPDVYNFNDFPFVDFRVRENYQNGNIAVMTINDKKYTFDFDKEVFVK